jgi:hypothetical protein
VRLDDPGDRPTDLRRDGPGEAGQDLWLIEHAGILRLLPEVLTRMTMLDLRAGQLEDAIGHLHDALQIISRIGGWFQLVNALYSCAYVCAATGRRAEAVTA